MAQSASLRRKFAHDLFDYVSFPAGTDPRLYKKGSCIWCVQQSMQEAQVPPVYLGTLSKVLDEQIAERLSASDTFTDETTGNGEGGVPEYVFVPREYGIAAPCHDCRMARNSPGPLPLRP